jgi:hypothetical protein
MAQPHKSLSKPVQATPQILARSVEGNLEQKVGQFSKETVIERQQAGISIGSVD